MPKDNNIPSYIAAAQAALKDIKAHTEFDELKKLLPAFAARLHQAGEGVITEFLHGEALKGAAHLKTRITELAKANTSLALTYEEVVKKFPVKNDDPLEDIDEQLVYYARKGDIPAIRRCLRQGADIHANEEAALRCAVRNGHLNAVKLLVAQS